MWDNTCGVCPDAQPEREHGNTGEDRGAKQAADGASDAGGDDGHGHVYGGPGGQVLRLSNTASGASAYFLTFIVALPSRSAA